MILIFTNCEAFVFQKKYRSYKKDVFFVAPAGWLDISSYPANIQVILRALKKYGLILADIGSNMYVSGAPDERWNNDELRELLQVKASDFEVVKFNN